jgi:hypothetical protein
MAFKNLAKDTACGGTIQMRGKKTGCFVAALGIFVVSSHSFSAYFLFLLAQKKKQKKGAPSP